MKLKAIYKSEDEIPEEFRALYEERDGQWELTGVEGVRTDADVLRLQAALKKERELHKAAKLRLTAFGDRTPEQIEELEDQITELQAAGGGAANDEAIEQRIAARVARERKDLDKQLKEARDEAERLRAAHIELSARDFRRSLRDELAATTAGDKGVPIVPEALADAELLAERLFERNEDGKFVTRDGVGVEPGQTVREWLADIVASNRRPHWVRGSQGAGATGGGSKSSGPVNNPFADKTWNATEASILVSKNPQLAIKLAKAAATPRALSIIAGLEK